MTRVEAVCKKKSKRRDFHSWNHEARMFIRFFVCKSISGAWCDCSGRRPCLRQGDEARTWSSRRVGSCMSSSMLAVGASELLDLCMFCKHRQPSSLSSHLSLVSATRYNSFRSLFSPLQICTSGGKIGLKLKRPEKCAERNGNVESWRDNVTW